MSEPAHKSVELTGSSTTSVEDAVQNALARASKKLHNLRWFELTQVRGMIEQGRLHLLFDRRAELRRPRPRLHSRAMWWV